MWDGGVSLVSIRRGVDMKMGGWFDDNFRMMVGNGVDTYF
jgi:hypothetical protein